MNDMTRSFGFIFRDDLLFGTAGWPYDEHYEAAPHAAPGRAARPLVRLRRVVLDRAGLELGAGGDRPNRPVEHAARLPHEQLSPRSSALPGNALRGRSSRPGRPATAKAA